MSTDFTVSDHLITRLAELGVDKLFGVPGDYNLGFLDRVLERPELDWVGCANELNASYAADGYARLKGFGALATTYGVGEFSALNGMAGARAEDVAVIEITGAPSTAAIEAGLAAHHTFGDGDYTRFARIGDGITAASAFLDARTATDEIDRVLTAAIATGHPVQLTIPSDVALAAAERPTAPLPTAPARADEHALTELASALEGVLPRDAASVVLAGHEAARLGLEHEVRDLVSAAAVPSAFLHRGKGVLDETDPRFLGLYAGELSEPSVRDAVDGADVVIAIGALFAGGVVPFTATVPPESVVELRRDTSVVAGVTHPVGLRDALPLVASALGHRPGAPSSTARSAVVDVAAAEDELTQQNTWTTLIARLGAERTISAEAGTSYYALLGSRLPADTTVVAQGMWSSIGYTFPAILGAQLADQTRRAVLVIGDGSLQLTAQEFGTFQRAGATPIVVVVNNDGYTVERAIHGATASYNDIATWSWQQTPHALGASDALVLRAETVGQLREALDTAWQEDGRLVVLELLLPELDVPPLLRKVADAVSRRNGFES